MSHKIVRPAFLTTFAAASATVLITTAGCGPTLTFSEGGGGSIDCTFGDPGCDEPCPASAPADGSSCLQDTQSCYWDDCDTGRGASATCNGGTWSVESYVVGCNPPPPEPECPRGSPADLSPCDVGFSGAYTCWYPDGCGFDMSATCGDDGHWYLDSSCNPPGPTDCTFFGDPGLCQQEEGCRWLVPGCDGNALPAAGCFSDFGCTEGSCDASEICVEVTVDECWDSDCQACATLTRVCL